jgi:ferredoxin
VGGTKSLTLHIDRERCTGHALCATFAGDVFVLDELGYNVTETAAIAPNFWDQARKGAAACPEQAIVLVEDDDPDAEER